jgi:hypothetical protein
MDSNYSGSSGESPSSQSDETSSEYFTTQKGESQYINQETEDKEETREWESEKD